MNPLHATLATKLKGCTIYFGTRRNTKWLIRTVEILALADAPPESFKRVIIDLWRPYRRINFKQKHFRKPNLCLCTIEVLYSQIPAEILNSISINYSDIPQGTLDKSATIVPLHPVAEIITAAF